MTTYPSKADQYGAAQLMRMAGTLAEQVEQWHGEAESLTPAEYLSLKAAAAAVYATLAHAAAVREQTEELCGYLDVIRDEIRLVWQTIEHGQRH